MNVVDIINKKRRGEALSTEEIDACMMNAVAFEDRWMDNYDDDDIRDDEFVNSDKSRSTVRMMSGRDTLSITFLCSNSRSFWSI